jgi:hypothetical protein
MHQQIMIAQKISASGPPAFTPNILSGLTYAMSAVHATIYKGGSTTSGLATADGDLAQRIDSLNAIPRTLYSAAGAPSLQTNEFGTGLSAVKADAQQWLVHTKPAGTAVPTVAQTVDSLFNAGTKLLLWAGTVDSANVDAGNFYSNDSIVADTGSGYMGLWCYQSGGNIVYQWSNYNAGPQIRTLTVAAGTPVIIACRHDGGNLRIAQNGVTWSAPIASGNTDSMGGEAFVGKIATGFSFRTSALVTCDATNSDTDILTVVNQMKALSGL